VARGVERLERDEATDERGAGGNLGRRQTPDFGPRQRALERKLTIHLHQPLPLGLPTPANPLDYLYSMRAGSPAGAAMGFGRRWCPRPRSTFKSRSERGNLVG